MFPMRPREERTLQDTSKKRKAASAVTPRKTACRTSTFPSESENPNQKGHAAQLIVPGTPKKRKVKSRRSVVAEVSFDNSPAGTRARKGGLTILERKSISGEQEGQYDYYLTNFKAFCKENKLRWPPKSKMDVTLADFFDVLYLQGYGSNAGE